MQTRFLYFFLFVSLFFFSACVKDKLNDLNVNYNGTLAFPVAQVGFVVEEALDDDSLYVTDSENAVRLIYRDENFYSLSAAEYLDDITGDLAVEQTKNFQIGSVTIDDTFVEADINLESIVDDFDDQVLKQFFLQNDGNNLPIPAFLEDIEDDINIPTFSDFTSLEIESGTLRLSVTNNFFFEVINLSATIYDEVNMQAIGTVEFDYIPAGGMAVEELDLAGKNLSNDFRIELGNLESPGTNGAPVTIDLQSSLLASMEIFDVVIKSGMVILPAGSYLTEEYIFELETDGDERIYKMELENSAIEYGFSSEVKTEFLLRLKFPDILQNGSPMVRDITVSNTGGSMAMGTFDFSNTIWQLDQDATQPYNRMRIEYEVLLPTGTSGQINFSANDEVNIKLLIDGLEPILIEGFLGKKEESVSGGDIDLGVDFDVFDEGSSPIVFDDPTIRVEVHNSFGVPLHLNINANAIGHFGGEAPLSAPNPLMINHPGIVGQSVVTNFIFDKNNSGIVDMLSIYPTSVNYDGTAIANPDDNPQTTNFVTSESELTASTEFELPFKFSVDNLVYRENGDAVDLGLDDELTTEDIDSAVVKISYHNDLPLQSVFTLKTINSAGVEKILLNDITLDAAMENAAGRVEEDGVAHGEIFVRLTQDQIQQLDDAVENVYEISFMTSGTNSEPSAIYSDYGVELNIGMAVTFNR